VLAGACTIVSPRRLLALVALAVVGLALVPALAAAITPQNVTVTRTDTRANAHADVIIGFDFGNASEQVRDLRLHLPAGLIGNRATPTSARRPTWPRTRAPLAARSGPPR
jgi:hypothetical protein